VDKATTYKASPDRLPHQIYGLHRWRLWFWVAMVQTALTKRTIDRPKRGAASVRPYFSGHRVTLA